MVVLPSCAWNWWGCRRAAIGRRLPAAWAGAPRLPPEAAAALLERPDGAQEVNLAERRPVGLAEVVLAVDALPRQKAAQPDLAAGAHDEVRVRAALGVGGGGDR